ncbi:MAG: SIMPL domain-containing protein [Clostridia bacterium]|jgi:uncharacterized protein YggE
MNNRLLIGTIAIVLIACIGIGALIFHNGEAVRSQGSAYAYGNEEKERVVNVIGNGKTNVKPDVAYINIGVATQNANAKQAQAENAKIMDSVVKKIKALGIKEEDIQTIRYNMDAQYDYPPDRKPVLTGYQVTNIVQVRIQDIQKTGDVLDEAAKAGANQAFEIRFALKDMDTVYKKALEKAVADAKSKADSIAKASNIQLMGPVSISESGTAHYLINGNRYSRDAALKVDMEYGSTPISIGELEVSASVTVSYAIK